MSLMEASADTESSSVQPAAVETVNLEDFVDVVYSYKCKFCQFSSNNPMGISSHVVQDHLAHNKKPVSVVDNVESNAVQITAASDHIHTDSKLLGNGEVIVNDSEVQVKLVTEEVVDNVQGDTVMVDSEASTQVEDGVSVQTKGKRIQGESLVIIERDGERQKIEEVITGDSGSTAPEQNGDYRELYVCGQCSVGFTDIEQCKGHMINEHNVSVTETTYETSEREYLGPNRVSVATQVQLNRKPGRKRKLESDVGQIIVTKEPVDVVYQKLENTDLSLITKRMAGIEGKRKVRPPRNLVEDYYIGKRKKKATHRKISRLQCTQKICRAKFRTKTALEVHLKSHRETPDETTEKPTSSFACTNCDSVFPNWKLLQMHLWKEHQIDTDLCKCPFCDFRADNWQKVDTHTQTHNEENPYECYVCGKSFKRQAQLSKHITDHEDSEHEGDDDASTHQGAPKHVPVVEGSGDLSPVCHICGRNFANLKSLKKHVELVHDKQKPYVCKYCGYSAGRKAMLNLHLRTHTGEKPFKCDMCNYQTGDHNTMRRHRMRHTGDRPYKCSFCPYQCIQSISLKTHLKNKHPGTDSIFSCDQCSYHTVNHSYYLNHLEDHKRGLVEASAPSVADKQARNIQPKIAIKPEKGVGHHLVVSQPMVNFVPGSNMISLAAKEAELIDAIQPEDRTPMELQPVDLQEGREEIETSMYQHLVLHQGTITSQGLVSAAGHHVSLTPLENAETFTIETSASSQPAYIGMLDAHSTNGQVILTVQGQGGGEQQIIVPSSANIASIINQGEGLQAVIDSQGEGLQAVIDSHGEGLHVIDSQRQGHYAVISGNGQGLHRVMETSGQGLHQVIDSQGEGLQHMIIKQGGEPHLEVESGEVNDSGAGLQHIITAIENLSEQGEAMQGADSNNL